MTLGVKRKSEEGILIEKVITDLKEKNENFSLKEIVEEIEKDEGASKRAKESTINMFSNAEKWGLFDKKGTPLKSIVQGGRVSVLDVSIYATMPGGWNIKSLVIALVSKKLFTQRMVARRDEEYQAVHESVHYFADEGQKKLDYPMVWMIVDEAHEFLPKDGKTPATGPLVTILREGRQPGISLVLASQQPGKIHTDVMTQADVILSHRITSKIDIDALGMLMQSYMRKGLDQYIDDLPREKGAAIILDDNNERMYPMRVRPRFTWHGGEAPVAIPSEKKIFSFE
jgi:DNA segregation ATPase FtsK/SpoIIIE-like protein